MRDSAATVLTLCIVLLVLSSPVRAADYSGLDITRVRIASISTIQCPQSVATNCLRLGVVILFRQASGTVASISTQYITGGSLISEIERDFGLYAPLVFRVAGEALAEAATQSSDEGVRRGAQNILPTINGRRHYTLESGVTLTIDTERIVGKIADEFHRRTGKNLLVAGADSRAADVRTTGMTEPEKTGLRDAAAIIGGSTTVDDISSSLIRMRFPPLVLRFWVNAFIPGTIPNLTVTVTGPTPSAGLTALPGPGLAIPNGSLCYLTDQRGFSGDAAAQHRMQIMVEVDLALSTLGSTSHSDPTTGVDCAGGITRCERRANPDRIQARNFGSETLSNGSRRYFVTLTAAGSNPCITVAPDIDWTMSVVVVWDCSSGRVTVSADGFIEPFPAFEMYANLNGSTPTTLFQEGPLTGSSPWNLPGSPNRSLTVVGKHVQ
jgi:hypothetical protein